MDRLILIRGILLGSFLLALYSIYMYTIMFHNMDLSYAYQKLQAEGLLYPSQNYGERVISGIGNTDYRYNINFLYVDSFKWQRIYLVYLVLSSMIFSYSLSFIRKDYKD